jgi:rhodanese-related sulfurtransferase
MISQVPPSEFSAWLQTLPVQGRAVLLDVREPWERHIASVPPEGFSVVSIPMGEIPSRLAELDVNQPLACLCHHGVRSQHVARFLAGRGFAVLANIAGGIDAWSTQRDAMVPRY